MNFIIENFNMLFDSEEGLKKLDEMILDLAVKGKLVEQDLNDEPASVLIEKIKVEKERLIKEKVIKKPKKLEPISEEEKPFNIPENWEWVRLGEFINFISGVSIKKEQEKKAGSIAYIKVSDMNRPDNQLYINTSARYLDFSKKIEKNIVPIGGIIFPKRGGAIATNKKRIINVDTIVDANTMAIAIPNEIFKFYFYFWFETIDLWKLNTGTSVPQINNKDIFPLLFPLPPLEEQKRIVAKIESLKELMKNLKIQVQIREKTRDGLKKNIMVEIEKSSGNKDLLKKLELIFQNFDIVVKKKEDIKDIRDLVLSMAVKGKLVEQDLNDEPASVLIEKIKVEKERLIKEKVIKKPKKLESISEEEKPFNIPENWEWVRFQDVLDVRDGTHDTPKYISKGIPLITSKNLDNGSLNFSNIKYISEEDHKNISLRSFVEDKDILFAMIGSIGNPVLVNKDKEFSIKNVALFKYYLKNNINEMFLYYYLNYSQSKMKNLAGGGVQKFVSLSFLRKYLFPLPPLAEQKKIVKRVDKLMELCDKLEEQVLKSENEMGILTKAITKIK